MTPPNDLDTVQRWMQAVIMHPGGVEVGVQSDDARSHIDVGPGELERVITRSRSLGAADRLAVYANAYYARLMECLREEFAVLAGVLGEELFDEFAVGYLREYPSRSYTLHHLGANFPRFLAESCPGEEGDAGWTTFVVDLATLERTYTEVFDGPGSEGREPLSAERLSEIPPEQWPDARLDVGESFRLVELRSPVHEYVSAVRRKEDPEIPPPAETRLAVHRRNYVVRRRAVNRAQFELLAAIRDGEPVGDAIGRAAEWAEDLGTFAAELQAWFHDWAREGYFRQVHLPGEP